MVTLVVGNAHRTVSQLKEPIDILFLDAEGVTWIISTSFCPWSALVD